MLYHVNEKDEIISKVTRNKAHSRPLLHRSGIVFLMNSQGKVLINKRSSEKKIFPSCYDSSVSFHVTYGESYEESAKRETYEEIQIETSSKYIGKFIHHDPPENQIVSVFICESDETPIIDLKEFSSQNFYTIREAEEIIRREKVTPWLKEGWKILKKHLLR